jgi:hypothetical protein
MLLLAVRVLIGVVLCSFVVVAGAWARESTMGPPSCSEAGTATVSAEYLPGHVLVSVSAPAAIVPAIAKYGFPVPAAESRLHYEPTYTRWCGHATASVRVHGVSYRIRGGLCEQTEAQQTRSAPVERTYGFAVGLETSRPAVGAKSLEFAVHYPPPLHRGTFRHPRPLYPGTFGLSEVDASIQLDGETRVQPRTVTAGTVTIGRSMRDGTFALILHDGTRATGSWACN